MEVGEHCSEQTCKRLDFLPFTCQNCKGIFCKEHCHPDNHSCPINNPSRKSHDGGGGGVGGAGVISPTHLCSVEGCVRREQIEITCPRCTLTLCLAHRHPEDHSCASLPPSSTHSTTRGLRPKTKATPTTPRARGGAKSESLAAKVALMRLKQRAEGLSSVPQSERVYYDVTLPAGSGVQSAPLFFSKEWAVGKMVDSVSRKFKISNHNDLPSCSKKLVLYAADGTPLIASRPLHSYLSLAPSGSCLRLDYEDQES